MATLKEAINYAKQNPTDPKSEKLKNAIIMGKMDSVAQAEGIDLSAFKSKVAPMASKVMPFIKQQADTVVAQVQEQAKAPLTSTEQAAIDRATRLGMTEQEAKTEILKQRVKTGEVDKGLAERAKEGFSEGLQSAEDRIYRRVEGRMKEEKQMEQLSGMDKVFAKIANLGKEVGTGFAVVTDPFVKAAEEVVSPIVQPVVEGAGEATMSVWEAIYGKDVAEVTKQEALEKVNNLFTAYENLPDDQKEVIDNTLRFADVATMFGGGKAVKEVGGEAVETGLKYGARGVEKVRPIVKEGAEALSKAITKTPEQLLKETDSFIDTSIEKAIRPTVRGKKTVEAVDQYQEKARSAVKAITENKQALNLTDEVGEQIALPNSLKSFSEAIKQTKQNVFKQYDDILRQAGDTGVVLDTVKLADDLAEVKKSPKWAVIEDNYPEVVEYVDSKIGILEKRGAYTLEQAQEAIKAYNNSLEAFYRNPTPEGYGKVTVDAMIVNNMRKSLDDVIESTTGGEYQALKNQYGALKAIEEDVAKRFIVNARKNQKGLIDFTDIFSAGDIIAGLTTFNPALIAKGATQNFIKNWFKKLNDPDRIIEKMFNKIDETSSSGFKQGAML